MLIARSRGGLVAAGSVCLSALRVDRAALRAASPGMTPGEAQRQNAMRKSKPQVRGSEIDANGVPNVFAVMLFTPVTY